MLRAIIPPLITAYAVFIAMVILAWRRPVARPPARSVLATRARLRSIVRTTVGGYIAFLVIVVIFHVWLAEESDAFASAVLGGAPLSGTAVAVAWSSSHSRNHLVSIVLLHPSPAGDPECYPLGCDAEPTESVFPRSTPLAKYVPVGPDGRRSHVVPTYGTSTTLATVLPS
jgi:hypothetical protein